MSTGSRKAAMKPPMEKTPQRIACNRATFGIWVLPQNENLNHSVGNDQQQDNIDQQCLPRFARGFSHLDRLDLANQIEPREGMVQCEQQSHYVEGYDSRISHQREGAVFGSRCEQR